MNTCKDCKYRSIRYCVALPPAYVGDGKSIHDEDADWAWAPPVVSADRQACSLFQPKEEVPALGEMFGEQSDD